MKGFIALAVLIAITAMVSTGCPRKLPVEKKLVEAPIASLAR